MKTFFILFALFFFLNSCSGENKQQEPKKQQQEIKTQLNSNTSITTPVTNSSQACYGGDIFLEKNTKITKIFESRTAEKGVFPYCSPKIEKIDETKANITLCYESGAGSGECSAAIFEFNIEKNTWTFLKNTYFGADFEIQENEELEKLFKYMKEKGYQLKK